MGTIKKILFLSFVPSLVFARGFSSFGSRQSKRLCLINVTSEEHPGNYTIKGVLCTNACCEEGCCRLEPWAVVLYALAGVFILYAVAQTIVSCRRKKIVDSTSRLQEAECNDKYM